MVSFFTLGGSRLQIASDLHIDAWQSVGQPIPFAPDPRADALILAGDLCNGLNRPALGWLLDLLEDPAIWPQGVFAILGNHDHYGLSLGLAYHAWSWLESACARLQVLDRRIAALPLADGRILRVAGCTLWSDFRRGNPLDLLAWRDTPDCSFVRIGSAGLPITPKDLYHAHRADRAWLEGLDPGSARHPLLVVTHHAPSWASADPRYPATNSAFVSDMDDLVLRMNPVAWVHGHTHAIHDYLIGSTRVLCQPVGYPGEAIRVGRVEEAAAA